MSPKESSLALDEVKEVLLQEYEPQLKVLVGKRHKNLESESTAEATKLGGKITVSF